MPSEQQMREAFLIQTPEHAAELIEAKDRWQDAAIGSLKRIAEYERQLTEERTRITELERQLADTRAALDNSQGLLVAMLHEQRPKSEIEAQIIENRAALAREPDSDAEGD